jgi:hypothetical protein
MTFAATPRKKRPGRQAQRLRVRLAEAQNWRCAWCRCNLEPFTVTIDHVIGLVLGGPDDWDNMVASCYPCNQRRGQETMRYFNTVVMGQRKETRAKRKRARIRAKRELCRCNREDSASL